MKERPRKFRPFTVCFDNYRRVSNLTRQEFEQLLVEDEVNWVALKGEKIDKTDLSVYKTRLQLTEPGETPSNKAIAQKLGISRNQVSKARKRVSEMLFKAGW